MLSGLIVKDPTVKCCCVQAPDTFPRVIAFESNSSNSFCCGDMVTHVITKLQTRGYLLLSRDKDTVMRRELPTYPTPSLCCGYLCGRCAWYIGVSSTTNSLPIVVVVLVADVR